MPEGEKDGVTRYPITFIHKTELERVLSENYKLQIQFDEGQAIYYAGGHPLDMFGYFGSRKSNDPYPATSSEAMTTAFHPTGSADTTTTAHALRVRVGWRFACRFSRYSVH